MSVKAYKLGETASGLHFGVKATLMIDVIELPPPPLKAGEKGAAVAELQKALIQIQWLPAKGATGAFDPATQAALAQLQAHWKLPRTGDYDDQTRLAIAHMLNGDQPSSSGLLLPTPPPETGGTPPKTPPHPPKTTTRPSNDAPSISALENTPGAQIKPGQEGASVETIKQLLGIAPADETYDPATVDAVIAFQKENGIRLKLGPDGVIDKHTYETLKADANDYVVITDHGDRDDKRTDKFKVYCPDTEAGQAIKAAVLQVDAGWPYSWGGGDTSGATLGSPGTSGAHTKGFDCSGLCLYAVYQGTRGRVTLGHFTGTQVSETKKVSTPAPGDLVFYEGSDPPAHVVMYIGRFNYSAAQKMWIGSKTDQGTRMVAEAPETGQKLHIREMDDGFQWTILTHPDYRG